MSDFDWMDEAECKDLDPNIFFSSDPYRVGIALAHCERCPVREPCLEHGINQGSSNQFGIFGGLDEVQRQRLINRRKRRKERARAA